jgi:hypothetical protein
MNKAQGQQEMQMNDDKILPEPDPGSHVSQIQSGD